MLQQHSADAILATVEYLETQLHAGKRSKVENPAGLIIYALENDLPVPATFVSTRRRQEVEQAANHHLTRQEREQEQQHEEELVYRQWIEARQQEALDERYTPAELEKKLTHLVADRVKNR